MITIKGKKYKSFADIKRKWMRNNKFRDEYNSHRLEFAIKSALMKARIEKRLSQKQIADKAGIQQSAVARFESGKYGATIAFTEKLARAVGVKIHVNS